MTDIPPLASLTIKDLRQLAGEHNVQNRSRLGKEELINALQQILAAQGGAAALQASAAAGSESAPAASAAHDHDEDEETIPHPIDHADADDHVSPAASEQAAEPASAPVAQDDEETVEALRPSLASEGAAEPEEITAESVALLTQRPRGNTSGSAAPAAAHGGAPRGEGQGPSHGNGNGNSNGNGNGDHAGHGEGVEFGNDGQPLDPNRRRRRRRRRRGRGRDDQLGFPPNEQGGRPASAEHDADGDDQEHDDAELEGDEEGQDAADQPLATQPRATSPPGATMPVRPQAPVRPQVQPAAAQAQPLQSHAHAHPHPHPHQAQAPSQHAPAGQPQRPQNGQPSAGQSRGNPQPMRPSQDARPPRPRLDGQVRSLPSVLDRLCVFSRGILELCSPDTPSWAQPRLSELLAECGMVMVPASGLPHGEFHDVVGVIPAKQVPPGHIAEMVSPGFALRGDRGDLFPLRKAKVRIAEGGAPPPAPRPSRPLDDATPAPVRPAAPVAAPAQIHDSVLDAPTEPQTDAPDAPDTAAPQQPSEPREPGAPSEDAEQAHGEMRNGAERPEARRLATRHQDGARPQMARPAPQAPASGRPPLRTHPRESAEQAPALPLATQVPDELAARPKAEGFRSLGLNDQILADLAAIGYAQPTPIQVEAIPIVISGKDLLGQAQTGTGKTAAFALPILQALYSIEGQGPVALVLCPTRELARQVHNEFTRMAGASGARAAIIYGGVPMDDQMRALERNPHVVIGTPGRIIDHMRRKTLDLSRLKVAVLDEADQMLDIGFWPDVQFIISHSPPSRQTLLFSATFPDPIRIMAEKHMKEPVHVRISPAQVTVAEVDQKYIAVPRERKNELLAHFIETQNPDQLVVFCKTKHQTDRVAEVLKRKNMSAAAIHGDLPQSKRERTLQAFRSRELQCLIATNVAARGLDIPTVSHVVNYDIPEAPEEYVHRIGRTARNGAKGIARTFITPDDGQFLVEIEKHIGLLLEEEKVEGFTEQIAPEIKRSIADLPVGTPRLLKPLVGGIRLGRRR